MPQATTNSPMTNEHTDVLPLLEEEDDFLDENNRFHPMYTKVQKMIESTVLSCEKCFEATN